MKYLVQVRDDVEAGDEKMKELEQEMKNWGIFDTDFCLGDILVDDEDNEPPENLKKKLSWRSFQCLKGKKVLSNMWGNTRKRAFQKKLC